MPDFAQGGVIFGEPVNIPVEIPPHAGEHVLTATGKVLRFDGERLVDTGERWSMEQIRAILERLNSA